MKSKTQMLWMLLLLITPVFSFSQIVPDINSNQGFEENIGQVFDESGKFRNDVYFVAHFSGANVFFTNEGVVFYFNKTEPSEFDKIRAGRIPNPYSDKEWEEIMRKFSGGEDLGDLMKSKSEFYRIDITFPAAKLNKPVGEHAKLETRNYYNPQHPDGLRDVPLYEKIRYENVYPGIDLVFYEQSGKLKYDFEVSANADPALIKIQYKGHQDIRVDETGNAVVKILPGEIIEKSPVSFQNGEKIETKFTISNDTIMFQLGEYDSSRPLTIDPSLNWSTYFYDGSTSAANTYTNPSWDSNGNMYIVLNTYNRTTFPLVNPGGSVYYQPTPGSTGTQLVIMKFNPSRQIVWSTYYSGSAASQVKYTNQSVAIDNSNNLYIIGSVFYVYGCPCTLPLQDMGGGAYYETEQGNNRNFILKFSSAGVRLWATMFNKTSGTSSSGLELSGITIDGNNKLVVTGCTYTPSGGWNPMPLVNPGSPYYYKNAPVESQVPTLHRFTTSGVLEWSTYISQGTSGKYCGSYSSIAIDASNNIFLCSDASSAYTTVNPGGAYIDGALGSGRKISIFKFASTGALNWCTLYGGTSSANSVIWQDARDIKIASNGDLFIVGRVNTTDFPTYSTGSAYIDNTLSTGSTSICDGVIMQFSNGGVRKWATYYGGNSTSDGTDFKGLGIDASNNIMVAGISRSTSFPTLFKTGSYNQSSITSDYAMVFAQFNINGVRQWASYFGNQTYISVGGFGAKTQTCGTKFVQCGWVDNAYSITTVNPGGGAYYNSSNEGTTGQTDVIVELFDEVAGAASTAPTGISGTSTICTGGSTTLTVQGGSLGSGANWYWYSGGCGGTLVGSGTSVVVSPTSNTNYYVRAEGDCNTTSCVSLLVSVLPNNTISLTAGGTQTKCINTPITTTTYATTGATGASVTGLPTGVTGSFASNVVTISGTPTVSGAFTYTVTLTGGCGTVSATGTITVTPNNTISLTAGGTQTKCINTPITTTTYATTGATGASVTGLPTGVTGSFASNVVTISGTPTVSGAYTYTVTLTGGCGTVTATGTITVTPNKTITLTAGGTQTKCINTPITTTTYATTGATGATITGLPAGVTGSWTSNTVTISGTPTVSGAFTYTVTLNGGCGTATATGTITVTPNNTITLTAGGTQTKCINTAITTTTYTTTGATGATITGLPAGVTGSWASNTVTISGTPTLSGASTYTVTLNGGCGTVTATGTITVTPNT